MKQGAEGLYSPQKSVRKENKKVHRLLKMKNNCGWGLGISLAPFKRWGSCLHGPHWTSASEAPWNDVVIGNEEHWAGRGQC